MMHFDYLIFSKIHGFAGTSNILDYIGIFLAEYMPYLMGIGAIVFFAIEISKRWNWKPLWMAVVSTILSRLIIVEAIRIFWNRSRPFVVFPNMSALVHHSASAGFPSGHISFFFALSGAIFLFNKRLGWIFFILSSMMGIARVFVGVHFLADILAGAVVGILSVYLSSLIFRRRGSKI